MSVQAASIQQYRGIKKRLRRAAKRTSPPTKTFVFYSRRHLRMNLAHDATVVERRMGNKKFPTRTKTYHGDVHQRVAIGVVVLLMLLLLKLHPSKIVNTSASTHISIKTTLWLLPVAVPSTCKSIFLLQHDHLIHPIYHIT